MNRDKVYELIKDGIADQSNNWLLVSFLGLDRIEKGLIDFSKAQKDESEESPCRSATLISNKIKMNLYADGGLLGVTLDIAKCEIVVAGMKDLGSFGKPPILIKKSNTKFPEKVEITYYDHNKRNITDYYRYDVFTCNYMQSPLNLDNLKKIIYKKYFYINTTKFGGGGKSKSEDTYLNDAYKVNATPKNINYNEVLLKQKTLDNPIDGFILNLNPKTIGQLVIQRANILELIIKNEKSVHVYNLDNKQIIKSYNSKDAKKLLNSEEFPK
jgi:hypothetical protein